jgi:hypothetical protein
MGSQRTWTFEGMNDMEGGGEGGGGGVYGGSSVSARRGNAIFVERR